MSDDLTPSERRIGESLLNRATQRRVWVISEYTMTVEPGDHEGRDGYDWWIHSNDGNMRAGGWEPSEAGALRACLDKLALLCKPTPAGHIPF